MKLPKGIKRLRASASEEVLQKALDLATGGAFSGYVRATAPKGVKEAGVVIFVQGEPRLAVFQSPQRSLYGPEALPEIKRISSSAGSFIRVEEFLAQSMEEVNTIVSKMVKAKIRKPDLERDLRVGTSGAPKVPELTREIDVGVKAKAKAPDAKKKDAEVPVAKGPGIRAKVEDRIARSQAEAAKEDEDILRMLKEVGMSPIDSEDEVKDDEVNQYIAAFEDFLKRQRDVEGPSATGEASQAMITVDDILDEMLDAAGDDPTMMGFIEDQRERILDRLSKEGLEAATDRRDRLSQQQTALEHISKTFREVLRASEKDMEARRSLIKEEDEGETQELEETEQRMDSLGDILERVLETHRERLEGAEEELEEATAKAQPAAEAQVAPESLDLEDAKRSFLQQMRARIKQAGDEGDAAVERDRVADATRSVSEGIHEKVEELEQERDSLAKERRHLEDEEEDLERQVGELQVDQAVEVQARLEEMEDREASLTKRDRELKAMEDRLLEERQKVESDLTRAHEEKDRIANLEKELQDREERLRSKEGEVEGLREHLEEELAGRASELEEMEGRLKAWEEELLSKEKELDASVKAVQKEREEEVEADLDRVKEIEAELREREVQYSSTIAKKEEIIEALREELRDNIARVEGLEGKLKALSEAEARIKELEDKLAAVAASGGGKGADDMDRDELRKLLAYLDDLLSKLPEEEIGRFSVSEYFELYGRILDKLGI